MNLSTRVTRLEEALVAAGITLPQVPKRPRRPATRTPTDEMAEALLAKAPLSGTAAQIAAIVSAPAARSTETLLGTVRLRAEEYGLSVERSRTRGRPRIWTIAALPPI